MQEFFDNLHEGYVTAEPRLVQDTTQAELDYITARVAEAEPAWEADSAGGMEDEADAAAEEREGGVCRGGRPGTSGTRPTS